jgi:hypothetical protein
MDMTDARMISPKVYENGRNMVNELHLAQNSTMKMSDQERILMEQQT